PSFATSTSASGRVPSLQLPEFLKTAASFPKTPPPPLHPLHLKRTAKLHPFSSLRAPVLGRDSASSTPSQNPTSLILTNPRLPDFSMRRAQDRLAHIEVPGACRWDRVA